MRAIEARTSHLCQRAGANRATSAEAAAAIGCSVAEIAKSIVFRARDSGQAVVVVASGDNRVSEGLAIDPVKPRQCRSDQARITPLIPQPAQEVDHGQHASPQGILDRLTLLPVGLIAEPLWRSLDRVQRACMRKRLPDQEVAFSVAQVAWLQGGAGSKGMFGQEPQTQPMDGRHIGPLDRHRFLNQSIGKKSYPDAFAQFAGGGLGEGHGKDAFGADDLALDPVGELGLDPMGLPSPCASGHDDQTEI